MESLLLFPHLFQYGYLFLSLANERGLKGPLNRTGKSCNLCAAQPERGV
jgi:hypothetical protein